MAGLPLAEQFVLLALAPRNDGWRVSSDGVPGVPGGVDTAAAGLLLAERVMAGEVVFTAGGGAREEASHIARLARDRPGRRALIGLRQRGMVREYETIRGRLVRRNVAYWFVPEDDSAAFLIVRRLRKALDDGVADEPSAVLLGVMRAYGLHRSYFRDLSRRERERVIQRAIGDHWVGVAVRRALGTDTALGAAANGSL
jgi:hypothetical protein